MKNIVILTTYLLIHSAFACSEGVNDDSLCEDIDGEV